MNERACSLACLRTYMLARCNLTGQDVQVDRMGRPVAQDLDIRPANARQSAFGRDESATTPTKAELHDTRFELSACGLVTGLDPTRAVGDFDASVDNVIDPLDPSRGVHRHCHRGRHALPRDLKSSNRPPM